MNTKDRLINATKISEKEFAKTYFELLDKLESHYVESSDICQGKLLMTDLALTAKEIETEMEAEWGKDRKSLNLRQEFVKRESEWAGEKYVNFGLYHTDSPNHFLYNVSMAEVLYRDQFERGLVSMSDFPELNPNITERIEPILFCARLKTETEGQLSRISNNNEYRERDFLSIVRDSLKKADKFLSEISQYSPIRDRDLINLIPETVFAAAEKYDTNPARKNAEDYRQALGLDLLKRDGAIKTYEKDGSPLSLMNDAEKYLQTAHLPIWMETSNKELQPEKYLTQKVFETGLRHDVMIGWAKKLLYPINSTEYQDHIKSYAYNRFKQSCLEYLKNNDLKNGFDNNSFCHAIDDLMKKDRDILKNMDIPPAVMETAVVLAGARRDVEIWNKIQPHTEDVSKRYDSLQPGENLTKSIPISKSHYLNAVAEEIVFSKAVKEIQRGPEAFRKFVVDTDGLKQQIPYMKGLESIEKGIQRAVDADVAQMKAKPKKDDYLERMERMKNALHGFFEAKRMKENNKGANAEKIEKIYKKDLKPFQEKKSFRLPGL